MYRISIATFLFWLCASVTHGAMVIHVSAGGGGGGSCATQSTVSSQTYASDVRIGIYADFLSGQSFQVPDNDTEVYSISIYIAFENDVASDQTLTLRVDDDTDLRTVAEGAASEPMATEDTSWTGGSAPTEVTFTFTSRPTLQSSTTYYLAVRSDNTLYGERIGIDGRASGDPDYADGQVWDYDTVTSWNLDSTVAGKYDMYFKINACD